MHTLKDRFDKENNWKKNKEKSLKDSENEKRQ